MAQPEMRYIHLITLGALITWSLALSAMALLAITSGLFAFVIPGREAGGGVGAER